MKMRSRWSLALIICCTVLSLSLVWISPAAAGRIIAANDDWIFSGTGFQVDARQFAQNIARWFVDDRSGSFLVYSDHFGLTGSELEEAMTSAGHSWTVDTSVPFELSTLQNYDGVFVGNLPADNDVLTDYVKQGGNVYVMGGDPSCAPMWNPFLERFGLRFEASINNLVGDIEINSTHALFAGVSHLYHINGTSLIDLDPSDTRNQVLASNPNGWLFAVYDPNPWGPITFCEYQSISTHGARDWESFTIGSDIFLAEANYYNNDTHNINSEIYKWNGDKNEFEPFQPIPTHAAYDWESFTIGSDTFLAVANYYNDVTYNINSEIYKWNGDENKFELFQPIPTHGACDWASFTIGPDTFLAVANFRNDTTYNIDSKIYIWNENTFAEAHSTPTHGAYDWASFTIGSDTFLAVANYGNDDTTCNIDSKIYKNNCINMKLDKGWHMISLPVVPESRILSDVFPGAMVVYGYDRNVGYIRVKLHEKLKVGEGYWILLNEARTYALTGECIQEYALAVENGWYMIGGCSCASAQASVENGNVEVIYGYKPETGYYRTENIEPGKGYWIKINGITGQSALTVACE